MTSARLPMVEVHCHRYLMLAVNSIQIHVILTSALLNWNLIFVTLAQEHVPFAYINRLNTIKSRSRTYTSSQKEELIYAINVLESSFSTGCQKVLSAHSFTYPPISPQLLCESVPIGTQRNNDDLVIWFKSNLHLLNEDSIGQLEKDEGISLDLGAGQVVIVDEIKRNAYT